MVLNGNFELILYTQWR